MSTIIPCPSVGSCVSWAGVANNRSPAPPSAPPLRWPRGPRRGCRRSKKSRGRRRTRVWVDEAGFYQLPGRVHTYAPCGQTPILTVPLTRDHLSVIGALTDDGRLVQQVRTPAFDGAGLVGFLRHLLRHIAGLLLVLWDGASIHRGQAVKEFFQQIGAERLWLERLPSYAPDWNPVEGV